MVIKKSELILNPDNSIYHLNLKPEHIASDIIFVGDQDRVDQITKHFETIEFTTQKREFKTTTGTYKKKRFSVISTGIGSDNIDIVLNELDALVNIDLKTRTVKKTHTQLNIVRIGTSGSLQTNIPINSFLISTYGLDLSGMLQAYKIDAITNSEIEEKFVKHTLWSNQKAYPIAIKNSKKLEDKLSSTKTFKGITATAGGFYGPQGRVLRLPVQDPNLIDKISSFNYNENSITNLEMETAAIYGLAKLLKHNACSINAIIANRANGTFSEAPYKTIEKLIIYTLNKLVE
ncbi:nucleoside phosphorylase [Tenacibaculum sp. UWU-22]|uniref:nucleoside phosphorylase n=1 Tax=Tenacibaculum sp. UWU-22 TaxID=3234187 RepID=UPI0034DB3517